MGADQPTVTSAMCAYGRSLAEPKLSPAGDRVAMVVSASGRTSLVIVGVDGGPELTVTSDPPPRGTHAYSGGVFDWTPDGAALVYASGDGGLWWVAATGGPSRPVVPPPAGGPAAAPAVSPDGTRVAFVVDQHSVMVAPLPRGVLGAALGASAGAWSARVSSGADFCFDPVWSPDGSSVAWIEWDVPAMPWDEARLVVAAVPWASGSPSAPVLVAGGHGVSVQQPRYSPAGDTLAFLSDASGWLNLWTVAVGPDGRPTAGARPLVAEPHEHGDPSWGLGQRSFAWSPDGRSVAFGRNEAGFGRLVTVEVDSGHTRYRGKGIHAGIGWAGDRVVAARSGARTPTQVVAYQLPGAGSPDAPRRTSLARGPVGGWEAAELPEPEVVHWEAGDGAAIHGRLYRPAPGGGDLPPLIVWLHGGPTGQLTVGFNPRIAYFVTRGWAVLAPDHRGSTGWGRAYTQAMAGRWGDLDTTDCAAGVAAAGANGWGDPNRVVAMGGSAGGFTVLNLLAAFPDRFAAGVDLYGVADLFDLAESTHRFEAHYLDSCVGPLPEAADRYRDRSPVNRAGAIAAPLLILQGEDDPVVPPAQSRAIAARMEALGRTVEAHFYPGEGHGWGRPDTVIDELDRVEAFLRRHVLTRRLASPRSAQPGGGPDPSEKETEQ